MIHAHQSSGPTDSTQSARDTGAAKIDWPKAADWLEGAVTLLGKQLKHVDGAKVMRALGVEKRRTAGSKLVGTLVLFGIGALVGAGALFAAAVLRKR